MSAGYQTIEERPPTVDELAVVCAVRAFRLSVDEAIGRLMPPAAADGGGRTRRAPRPVPPYLKLYRG